MSRCTPCRLPTLLMAAASFCLSFTALAAEPAADPVDLLARPSPQHLAWHEMEIEMFLCLDPATWQNREYDDHSTPLSQINPTKLDTDQWCRVAQSFGAKQIIFVAKHAGGFCWWQTETTRYGVKNTPWKQGKGDVLGELANSCKKHGLKLGIYVYPSDEMFDAPIGTGGKTRDPAKQEAYNKAYRQQMTEVLSNYGPVDEVWFDGGCVIELGDILKKLAPQAMVFQGPYATIRWVGNEIGVGPDPCWNAVKKADAVSGVATAIHGDPNGDTWLPNEVDTPLLDHNWFWSENSDGRLKTLDQLMDTYYKSVGRGCVLLLNATPDTSGAIPESHVRCYAEFGAEIQRRFGRSVAQAQGDGEITAITLDQPTLLNHAVMMEDIAQGQRVRAYVVEGQIENQWRPLCRGTSIGYKKIDAFEPVTVSAIRLRILESAGPALIKQFAVYHVEPTSGSVTPSQTPSRRKAIAQQVGVWDAKKLTADWTTFDIDLSPFIPKADQYEVRFEKTSGAGGFEIQSAVVVLEGVPAPDFVQPRSEPNTFIVNRTAVVSADRKESTHLRVKMRRIGSGDCTVTASIRPWSLDGEGK